jgi:hypothetical protein
MQAGIEWGSEHITGGSWWVLVIMKFLCRFTTTGERALVFEIFK